MKKIVLTLKRKGVYCYFSNPKSESENELFSSKIEAGKSLITLFKEKVITATNALELLEKIAELRDFPIVPKKLRKHESFIDADLDGLKDMLKLQLVFKIFSEREKLKNLPTLSMCPNCNSHGAIIGKGFESGECMTKIQAREELEELFLLGKVTPAEKTSLEKEIRKSNLPEQDPEMCSTLN